MQNQSAVAKNPKGTKKRSGYEKRGRKSRKERPRIMKGTRITCLLSLGGEGVPTLHVSPLPLIMSHVTTLTACWS